MCVHVCAPVYCVYMALCMWACVCVWVCLYLFVDMCAHVYVCDMSVSVCVCVFMSVYACACVRVNMLPVCFCRCVHVSVSVSLCAGRCVCRVSVRVSVCAHACVYVSASTLWAVTLGSPPLAGDTQIALGPDCSGVPWIAEGTGPRVLWTIAASVLYIRSAQKTLGNTYR